MMRFVTMFPLTLLVGTLALASCVATSAMAAPVTSEYALIKLVDGYAGDTLVFLEKNPAKCDQGYWFRPTQAKFSANLALIEKAAHSNARVKIVANDAEMWPQMDVKRCRLQSVEVEDVAHVDPASEGPKGAETDDPSVVDPRATQPAPPPSPYKDPAAK